MISLTNYDVLHKKLSHTYDDFRNFDNTVFVSSFYRVLPEQIMIERILDIEERGSKGEALTDIEEVQYNFDKVVKLGIYISHLNGRRSAFSVSFLTEDLDHHLNFDPEQDSSLFEFISEGIGCNALAFDKKDYQGNVLSRLTDIVGDDYDLETLLNEVFISHSHEWLFFASERVTFDLLLSGSVSKVGLNCTIKPSFVNKLTLEKARKLIKSRGFFYH